MAKKITAIINHKGGVGKTAISTNLSYALSELGKKILLIDLDPQAHSCIVFCDDVSEDNNVSNVIRDRSYSIKNAIVQAQTQGDDIENLYVLPSDLQLSLTEVEIYGRTRFEKLLHRQLNKVADDFDYVIIDCPPNLGPLTQNAIFASNDILVPINYDNFALRGVKTLFDKIHDVKEDQPDYSIKVIRNKRDIRDKKMTTTIESELSNNLPDQYLVNTIIRKASVLEQSRIDLEPIAIHAPKSAVKKDYDDLAKEYII
ncbi:ParA family protein [Fangia hongkongensis]|uniref:ParA family protein n=1 Tax=Fangia hongkongensis TaxID=270495 RepID=UPI00036ED688|nr:AAA family ATPase [Fangia hongkongensis]MBK2125735.1 AAA family ATPase [Fangia hongkongensis]